MTKEQQDATSAAVGSSSNAAAGDQALAGSGGAREPAPRSIQERPEYREGFDDAQSGAALHEDACAEYAAGWRAFHDAIDAAAAIRRAPPPIDRDDPGPLPECLKRGKP